MKFKVNAGKFASKLNPVHKIATKGAIKDFDLSFKITLDANPDEFCALAYGGHLATSVKISDINDPEVDYDCETPGIATVNATDFINSLNSFPPETGVTICVDGSEVKIIKTSDNEEFQTCPMFDTNIEIPKKAKKYDKEINIVKGVLLEGINKILFGIGFEKHKPQYLNYVIEADKGHVRFITGTGGRFAVWDVEGKSCVSVNEKCRIFLPKEQTPVVMEIIAESDTDDNIIISQGIVDSKPQILFQIGKIEVILVGIDIDVKYPDISQLMKEKKNIVVATKAEDWEYSTKGLKATFNEEVKKLHNTHESDLTLKLDSNYVLLTSKTNMKSSRKVPIVDIREKGDSDSLRFHTTTNYISEIYASSDKEDDITLEFVDSKQPAFARFPRKDNKALGSHSNLTLFFAALQG